MPAAGRQRTLRGTLRVEALAVLMARTLTGVAAALVALAARALSGDGVRIAIGIHCARLHTQIEAIARAVNAKRAGWET